MGQAVAVGVDVVDDDDFVVVLGSCCWFLDCAAADLSPNCSCISSYVNPTCQPISVVFFRFLSFVLAFEVSSVTALDLRGVLAVKDGRAPIVGLLSVVVGPLSCTSDIITVLYLVDWCFTCFRACHPLEFEFGGWKPY